MVASPRHADLKRHINASRTRNKRWMGSTAGKNIACNDCRPLWAHPSHSLHGPICCSRKPPSTLPASQPALYINTPAPRPCSGSQTSQYISIPSDTLWLAYGYANTRELITHDASHGYSCACRPVSSMVCSGLCSKHTSACVADPPPTHCRWKSRPQRSKQTLVCFKRLQITCMPSFWVRLAVMLWPSRAALTVRQDLAQAFSRTRFTRVARTPSVHSFASLQIHLLPLMCHALAALQRLCRQGVSIHFQSQEPTLVLVSASRPVDAVGFSGPWRSFIIRLDRHLAESDIW